MGMTLASIWDLNSFTFAISSGSSECDNDTFLQFTAMFTSSLQAGYVLEISVLYTLAQAGKHTAATGVPRQRRGSLAKGIGGTSV